VKEVAAKIREIELKRIKEEEIRIQREIEDKERRILEQEAVVSPISTREQIQLLTIKDLPVDEISDQTFVQQEESPSQAVIVSQDIHIIP
jgi:hypothetical protein